MKRKYELMLVLKTGGVADDEKKVRALVEKLVGAAEITDLTVMGKKMLAYPIKKQKDGVFVLVHLSGNVKVSDIERESKLGDDVVRFLLTVKEG